MHRECVDRERYIPVCSAKSVFAYECESRFRYEAANKLLQKREITISTVQYINLKADRAASKRISRDLLKKLAFCKETIRDIGKRAGRLLLKRN